MDLKPTFNTIKNNATLVLVVACFVLGFLFLQQCNRNAELKAESERQAKLNQQNMSAMLDSIHVVKDKVGATEYDKASYVAELKDLKSLNTALYNKIKAVEGNVISMIDSKVQGSIPPMTSDNLMINYSDSVTHGLRFRCSYVDSGFTSVVGGVSKFKAINGKLFKDSTIIDENKITIDIAYGFKESDEKYECFAKSTSKYITFNQLDGALMITKNNIQCPPQKKKRWSVGPFLGYGFALGSRKLDFMFGIGVQYGILRF